MEECVLLIFRADNLCFAGIAIKARCGFYRMYSYIEQQELENSFIFPMLNYVVFVIRLLVRRRPTLVIYRGPT